MFCTRCRDFQPTVGKTLDFKLFQIEGHVQRVDCKVCKQFIAIIEGDTVINVDEVIDNSAEGWTKVRTKRDRIIYCTLCQIIYPEVDTPQKDKLESLYAIADDEDHVYLRWLDGRPVGFYTIKPKGSEIFNTGCQYSMNTVDTAYIRSKYRRQGLGMEILYDVVKRYQKQDVGFSKPISHGMLQVIKRFLTKHKEYRLHLWEVEDGGAEGCVKLIWFTLRKQIQ